MAMPLTARSTPNGLYTGSDSWRSTGYMYLETTIRFVHLERYCVSNNKAIYKLTIYYYRQLYYNS